MARKPRYVSSSGFYHFMTRGVNKKKIFHKPKDYEYYLNLLMEYRLKLNIDIFHYCIMSNHAHLILRSNSIEELSQFGHFTHRRYAYYYCKTYHWSEQVFRRNFLSIPINDDAYLLECGRYIERNPVDAGLVKDPQDHPYSSYNFYVFRKENKLLSLSPSYLALGHTSSERATIYKFHVCHQRNEMVKAPF